MEGQARPGMQRHLQENEIDLLILAPDSLPQANRIKYESHVVECALCAEHLAVAREFYARLPNSLAKEPSPDQLKVVDRIFGRQSRLQLPFRGVIPSRNVQGTVVGFTDPDTSLARRFTKLVVQRPVRTAAGIGLIAAAIVFGTFLFRGFPKSELTYVQVQNGILSACAADGTILWQKLAPVMPDGSTLSGFKDTNGKFLTHSPVLVLDIHPQSGAEVVLHWHARGLTPVPGFSPESLYCFDSRGQLLWAKAYPVQEFADYQKVKGGMWYISAIFTIRDDGKKDGARSGDSRDRLFLTENLTPFSPSSLVEVDGTTGSPRQMYRHFGNIRVAPQYDQEEGRTRLILTGTNNGYEKIFIAALDLDRISGSGPAPKRFDKQIEGGTGNEIRYLLLPRTEMSKRFGKYPYNSIGEVRPLSDGSLIISTLEFPDQGDFYSGGVYYSFDPEFSNASVTFGDDLQKTHQKLMKLDASLPPLDLRYSETIVEEVKYWDGGRFVSLVAKNRNLRRQLHLP